MLVSNINYLKSLIDQLNYFRELIPIIPFNFWDFLIKKKKRKLLLLFVEKYFAIIKWVDNNIIYGFKEARFANAILVILDKEQDFQHFINFDLENAMKGCE